VDRFYRGFFAGIIAGVPMNIWSLFSFHVINLGDLRFLDWIGIILYGELPITFFQQIYSLGSHLFWLGFLGIVFAYLVPHTTSRWYIGKAIIFSGSVGFLTYAIPLLYKVPHLTQHSATTVLSNHLGALIWGWTLGYLMRKFDSTPATNQHR